MANPEQIQKHLQANAEVVPLSGRLFTVGELWGPFPCEVCELESTFTIKLSDDENNSLPEQFGPVAVRHIFDNKLGIAICSDCLKESTPNGQ